MSYYAPNGNHFLNNSSIEERFPVCCRIKLLSMPNDPNPIHPGTTGTVVWPDRMGITVNWDNGRTLSVIPGVDLFVRIG